MSAALRVRRALRAILPLAALLPLAAAGAQRPAAGGLVPGQRCVLQFEGSQGGRITRTTSTKLPSGKYNVFVGGGFLGSCQGQDVTLRSDSAEYYGDLGTLYLIGNVHYAEPRAKVDADHMTYWMPEEHLRGEGNVYAVLAAGSTMRGPVADYYRAVAGIRTQAMLTATGQPHLALVQIDSVTHQPSDTVYVVSEHITTIADSLVYAGGNVRLTRPELLATGDSAFLDQGSGRARLMVKPSVEARRDRPFTLTGGVIDVFAQNRIVNRIVATPNGHATSEDVQLFADSIDLRVRANELERAMAWGKTRARATSTQQDLLADSIDAHLPGQRLRMMIAVGRAYATALPDTALHTTERDWMQGDTVIAAFDSTARDTAHTPPVKSIHAVTDARAFYHLQGRDRKDPRPAINYVRGRVINVAFANQQVQLVTVHDSASGIYVEPGDSTSTAPAKPAAPRKTPSPRPARPSGGIVPGRPGTGP